MKKVLITGISGFVGNHLAQYLLSKSEYELIGTYRSEKGLSTLADQKNIIKLVQVDLLNQKEVEGLIESHPVDHIYHLAGLTSAAESFNHPSESMMNNIVSELNVLEELKKREMKQTRMLIVSTAEVYGMIKYSDLPIDEETELRPLNPYAVSKIAQDFLGLQYHLSYGMDVVRVRPFNHIGPYQKDNFALPSFAKQIAEIEKGICEPVLKVGNLEAKRDFSDVRDIVRGYTLLMEKGASGDVYNIGSGQPHRVKDLLQMLLSFSKKKIEVQEDPEKLRPIEVKEVRCDYSKLHELTGWKPEIPIEKTLQDILDYWREIV